MKLPIPDPGAVSGTIDKLLGGMSRRTTDMIRQMFFLFMFILIVAGIIIGYGKGKKSATITDTPLSERINDVFEYDIKRERGEGTFSSMLESELTSEMKMSAHAKRQFPAREELQPETSSEILESPTTEGPIIRGPSESEKNGLYEGTYDKTLPQIPDVNTMKREYKPESGEPLIDRREKLPPLDEIKTAPAKKTGTQDGKIMAPAPSGKPEPMDKTEILE